MEPKKKISLDDIFGDDEFGLLNTKPAAGGAVNEDTRLLESFGDIERFFETNTRIPAAGGNIQEAALFYRLRGILTSATKKEQLKEHDKHGLLQTALPQPEPVSSIADILSSDAFGLLDSGAESIFDLRHVQPPKQTTMPDYIASRKPCKDFADFEQLFKDCQVALKLGNRKLLPFRNGQQIDKGYFFVLQGILLYVAEVGEKEIDKGATNARLRCIFENGTESDLLLRSLSAGLYKDGRRVTEHEDNLLGSLRGITEEDQEAGYIYVLRSLSTRPEIAGIQNLYKIGFSKVEVEERVKNATKEPTYLMAPVKIVTAFKCDNMNPQKLEQLAHNFFGSACLNVDVYDQSGNRHIPREWFLAPLGVIVDAIQAIVSGEILQLRYDAETQEIVTR